MSFFSFLHSQLFASLPKPTDSFAGKTILVTGSNVGLGKEAARHFVRQGASKVILAVRSTSKGEAAQRDIESSTGKSGVIDVWTLDMASYASVLAFAERAEKELDRLDVAILNAGVARGKWEVFEQDEATITVNVVSTLLLSFALLPTLKRTAAKHNVRPNLTIVASEVHAWAKFEERHAPPGQLYERLNQKNDSESALAERYQVSKLLEVLFIRAMADRRPASQIPVTINCVNPGLCHSELSREAGIALTIMKFFLARSTELGSRTLVHAGTQGPETHGQYMSDCRITPPSDFVLSKEGYEAQERVWKETVERLEGIKKGITEGF
ncbi:NAD(P)-binding protein [Corynespora cassiicola Philippines]|uniref:NAD(P)-binding protein n=1 Tax=Corynespora cassiicola Philippines TaxID=1448308 RepID=A0A2T2N2M0_CORCC|nr:NAD(P)-binding protein [Corynespora cassiicola Philippines]